MTSITQHNFKAFKRRYALAVKLGEKSFFFEGQEVLTEYAKYLVQYVESLRKD